MLKRVHWNADAQPYDQTLDRVLYDLRRADPDNLLLDAVSMTDILEDSDGVLLFDAMTTPFARLPRMMEMLKGAMQHFSATVKPLDMTISEPFSARGVANVSAIFSLSDGQNLSVYFHNPDTKPKSIGANDEMISWKWMLNKLDVTIVVAPERGKELNIREVARRIMKLAEKNSAAFQRANGKRAERMKKIEGLKEEVAALELELTQAQKDLEVAKLAAEDRAIDAYAAAAQVAKKLPGRDKYSTDQAYQYVQEWGEYDFPNEEDAARYARSLEAGEGGLWRAEMQRSGLWRAHRVNSKNEPTFMDWDGALEDAYQAAKESGNTALEQEIGDMSIAEVMARFASPDAVRLYGGKASVQAGVVKAKEGLSLQIKDAVEKSLQSLAGVVETSDGMKWGISASKLNKMVAATNADGPKPFQRERIMAIQQLQELAKAVGAPKVRPDDGRDENVEAVYEYFTKFEAFGEVRGVRILCKKLKLQTKQQKDSMHSIAMDKAGEVPVTRIDTDGLLADLEIFELEAQSGDGVSPVSERLSPPSISNESMLGSSAQDVNGQNAGTLTPEGRESKVKTAKGNEVVTGFTVVEADTLITSHDAESGTPNPAFPPELQPRDRGRDTSRAWVIKTAGNLDPEQLGSTRRADTGAPIVGPDGIVESGNGRTMAIVLAYAHGKAAEYRDWLESEAEYFGLSVNKVKAMRKPVLVRVRTSQIDRAAFAVEANQDDKLAMTATEKARADARRLTDGMIALMTDNGDLTAVANQPFLSAFLKSLGDAEAAQYSTSDGKPTSTLIARVQAAIFAKAYNDHRLLELTADAAKPEIANIISALNFAAPEFIQAAALDTEASDAASKKLVDSIETSLNAQAVNAILGATNVLKQAKEAGMQVDEFIKQQGLFSDIDPAVAAMAVFISKNNRSGKRMGTAFKAMATFVKGEIQRRQTADMFGAPEPIGFEAIVAAANREMDRVFGEGSFAIEVGDLFASKNDPEPTPPPTEAPTPQPTPDPMPTPQQDPAKAAAIAMMQAIIDGTTDPLTADLDVLEQAFTSYQDDAEVESLFEQAVDVVMQAAAKATEGVTA